MAAYSPRQQREGDQPPPQDATPTGAGATTPRPSRTVQDEQAILNEAAALLDQALGGAQGQVEVPASPPVGALLALAVHEAQHGSLARGLCLTLTEQSHLLRVQIVIKLGCARRKCCVLSSPLYARSYYTQRLVLDGQCRKGRMMSIEARHCRAL